MATDIEVNTNKETTWNNNGDLTTVRGADELAQSFFISIITNVRLRPESLTPQDIAAKEGEIQTAVQNNERSEAPIDVFASIETDDDGTQYVEYEVITNSVRLIVDSQ